MSTGQVDYGTDAAPGRSRWRFLLQSGVLLLAVTACCMFAGLIADRYPVHIDATATREHRLGERTVDLLRRLETSPGDGPFELIVTVNAASIDAAAARRTQDVLDAMARQSPRLQVSIIDAASADGLSRLDAALARAMAASKESITSQVARLDAALDEFAEIAANLEAVAGGLTRVAESAPQDGTDAAPLKRFLSESAAVCRLNAQDLLRAGDAARQTLRQPIGRTPVPSVDAAKVAIRTPIDQLAERLVTLIESLNGIVDPAATTIPESVKEDLRPPASNLPRLKDQASRLLANLDSLPNVPLVSVARVLERSSAAVVMGPPGAGGRSVAAIDIDSLFPPASPAADQPTTQVDLRARTEDLLGSALATLIEPPGPIVVLAHNEPATLAPGFERISAIVERLRLRNMDVVEWATAVEPQPPSIATAPPGGRPVVYVVFYSMPGTVDGAKRLVGLSRATKALFDSGKSVLLSVTPSTIPALGQPDGMIDYLSTTGLTVDSGRPLLHLAGTPASPIVQTDSLLTVESPTHPVAAAVKGLRIRLPWAVPMEISRNSSGAVVPILTLEDDGRTWAESQWMEFASVPAGQRSLIRPQDLPRPDSARDDEDGPWVVGVAVERSVPRSGGRQRWVVIGCNPWFLNDVAFAQRLVDNRLGFANPGNPELFESSIYWLAGREGMIAASPQATAAPVVPAMSEGALAAVRWMLIAGVPLIILLIGAGWRVLRG